MERKAERNGSGPPTVVTVGPVRFGRDPFPVIAGPSSVEDSDQVKQAAVAVAEGGGAVLRGGTFTASTYGFAGLGLAGLDMLAAAAEEVGLPVVTQVVAPGDVDAVSDRVDMLEVGEGSMQDFELLRAVGSSGKPVLLRRGPSATIDEWLWAAEYVLDGGNDQVVLVERGIRTFGDQGMTLDIGAIPMVKERSHLPVLVDPSGPAGGTSRVPPLALAAQGVGADGLIVEVHARPDQARSGGPSQLDPSGLPRPDGRARRGPDAARGGHGGPGHRPTARRAPAVGSRHRKGQGGPGHTGVRPVARGGVARHHPDRGRAPRSRPRPHRLRSSSRSSRNPAPAQRRARQE